MNNDSFFLARNSMNFGFCFDFFFMEKLFYMYMEKGDVFVNFIFDELTAYF